MRAHTHTYIVVLDAPTYFIYNMINYICVCINADFC